MIYYPEVISDIFKRGILSPWKMLRCFLRALSNTTFMSGLTRVLRDPETSLSFTALDLQRPYFTFVDQLIDLLSTGREYEKIVATIKYYPITRCNLNLLTRRYSDISGFGLHYNEIAKF